MNRSGLGNRIWEGKKQRMSTENYWMNNNFWNGVSLAAYAQRGCTFVFQHSEFIKITFFGVICHDIDTWILVKKFGRNPKFDRDRIKKRIEK